MQNFLKKLNRNLSTRQLIINLTRDNNIFVTVVQHEQNNASVIMMDDKQYKNSGFKGGVISFYTNAIKDIVEILYDVSQHPRVKQYSSDFLGKTYVDFIIPDKYNSSYFKDCKIVLNNGQITQQTIDDIKDDILKQTLNANPGKTVLHSVVCNWELDDNFIDNPKGLEGSVLRCYMHFILIDKSIQNNFENLLAEKGLVLNSICPRVCLDVANYSSKTFSSRTMLLSINEDITTFSIILDNDIVFCDKINIGFQHIVNDITAVFNISIKQAIDYIAEYGVVYEKDGVKLQIDKEVDRELLYNVIFSRVYEMMSKIKKEYIGNMINVDRICILNTKISGIEQCTEKIFDGIEVLPLKLEKYNQRLLLSNVAEDKKGNMLSRFFNFFYN